MEVYFNSTSEIEARLGIQEGGPVHSFFTDTCVKHMDPYTPFDTGTMARTTYEDGQVNHLNVTYDTIIYNTDYARYVYYPYRNGKYISYTTEHHKDAGPYWDKYMWNNEKDDVVKEVNDFIDRGEK